MVRRHQEQLVLELLLVRRTIYSGLLLGHIIVVRLGYGTHHVRGRIARCGVTAAPWCVDSHQVEIVESFCNLAQLVLVLLIVECRTHGLYRLVPLGLALLRHEQDLVRAFFFKVIQRLTLDDLLFEE